MFVMPLNESHSKKLAYIEGSATGLESVGPDQT